MLGAKQAQALKAQPHQAHMNAMNKVAANAVNTWTNGLKHSKNTPKSLFEAFQTVTQLQSSQSATKQPVNAPQTTAKPPPPKKWYQSSAKF
jgi:hypothetical protein